MVCRFQFWSCSIVKVHRCHGLVIFILNCSSEYSSIKCKLIIKFKKKKFKLRRREADDLLNGQPYKCHGRFGFELEVLFVSH